MNTGVVEPVPGADLRWQWDGFLPRSYLFSLEALDRRPPNLREMPVPVGHLFISPDYDCHVRSTNSSFIALIGYCIDLDRPGDDEDAVASTLLDHATRDGIDAMLARTDDLFGRFAVICHIRGTWHVFGDANATRTIYFAEDRPMIASHSTMLGDLIGQAPRMELFRHYWCALPGNASPVPRVRVLPANFVLDPASQTMRRFWPRAPRHERSVADTVDELDALLVKAADATLARWKPALSLTSGVDSRLTLSIYQNAPDLFVFTYDRHQGDKVDVEGARRVCERLGITHHRLPLVDRRRAEPAYRLIESIVDCSFDKNVAPILLETFQARQDFVHVRSSLTGVGKAFWRYHPNMPTEFDPSSWVQVSLSKSAAHLPGRAEAATYLVAEMRRFFGAVGYDRVDWRSPEIMGYDVWDLVYMEHRMSTWHAQTLSGADMASETSILFNCRRVVDLMVSVPLADRRRAALFRTITARRCPQLADIAINPRPRRTFGQLAAAAYRQLKRRTGVVRAIETRVKH
jgi:asparagine synthetase B (glutamine-hydrolysing)